MPMKIIGDRLYVKLLDLSDAEALLQLELSNRNFFQQYSALNDDRFYTLEAQQERIRKDLEKQALDQRYLFGIYLHDSDELIGGIMLSNVIRGPLQSCILGYSLDHGHNGKGYMTEAVRLMVSYAFNELKLHRIEAGVMPNNIPSIRVLEKAGFHKEGIAKKNVKINGKWEDHQMLAVLNDED